MSAPYATVPVSVVVLARNEEENLPRCLSALAWSDDVLVVDDESTDRTVHVAQSLGARVLSRRFDSFAGQRNWALDCGSLRHAWVLHIDADEVVTPDLAREITDAIGDERFSAYRIPSRLIFMGRWLKRCTDYPVYQVRLGRNPGLRFAQVGHGQREVVDPRRVGTLLQPYDHHSFSKGLDEWFAKHNRYSTAEAVVRMSSRGSVRGRDLLGADPVARRRALKALAARLPAQPALRFLWAYVARGGFLEGRPGFVYCRLMAIYEAMIVAKVAVMRAEGRREGEG